MISDEGLTESKLDYEFNYETEIEWRVDIRDSLGAVTEGPVWHFTTTYCIPNTPGETECNALAKFYQEDTHGEGWIIDDNWLEAPMCEWYGVDCDDNGHVAHLLLPNNGITGETLDALRNEP